MSNEKFKKQMHIFQAILKQFSINCVVFCFLWVPLHIEDITPTAPGSFIMRYTASLSLLYPFKTGAQF